MHARSTGRINDRRRIDDRRLWFPASPDPGHRRRPHQPSPLRRRRARARRHQGPAPHGRVTSNSVPVWPPSRRPRIRPELSAQNPDWRRVATEASRLDRVREGPVVLRCWTAAGDPDRAGRSRLGITRCGVPFPVEDGSVRIVCGATDRPGYDPETDEVSAFAFDADGRLMSGWPVRRPGNSVFGMGDDLTVLTESRVLDSEYERSPTTLWCRISPPMAPSAMAHPSRWT
jgi:hypothetical protein